MAAVSVDYCWQLESRVQRRPCRIFIICAWVPPLNDFGVSIPLVRIYLQSKFMSQKVSGPQNMMKRAMSRKRSLTPPTPSKSRINPPPLQLPRSVSRIVDPPLDPLSALLLLLLCRGSFPWATAEGAVVGARVILLACWPINWFCIRTAPSSAYTSRA